MTIEELAKRKLSAMYGKMCFPVHNLPTVVSIHLVQVMMDNHPAPDKRGEPQAYEFYLDRLLSIPHYGEKAGNELIRCICRCAFNDPVLTDAESISIINICHSPEWYKIFKEMDFNEGWN